MVKGSFLVGVCGLLDSGCGRCLLAGQLCGLMWCFLWFPQVMGL